MNDVAMLVGDAVKSQHHASENIPGDTAVHRQPQPRRRVDSRVMD